MARTTRVSLFLGGILMALSACATHELQIADQNPPDALATKDLSSRIYLLGDAGNAPEGASTPAITAFGNALTQAPDNSTALFLGDNIYEKGMPAKQHPERALAEHRLQVQLDALQGFNGKSFFISGNHDWYYDGLKSLEAQEDYIEENSGEKAVFLPAKGCPLEEVALDDRTHLIIVDSPWYLADWDEHPTMNDNCDIKSRKRFFIEFESMLKKQEGKTVIIAIHHPTETYGPHGGYFSAEKHLFPFQKKIPLPGIGSLIAMARSNGGVSHEDLQNGFYRDYINRLKTIVREAPVKAVFVSGHEHSLQYIDDGTFKQVISGSGAKTSPARLTGNAKFTYGDQGFAILDTYTDGSSAVKFYNADTSNTSPLYQTRLYPADTLILPEVTQTELPAYTSVSVYSEEEIKVSKAFKNLWGDHYRELYGIKIKAQTALLDTLYGGLTPVRMGGGHQTNTLRLRHADGREYNLRALKKSGIKFLQSVALKDKNLSAEALSGTLPDDLLMDFYTTAHPYASFTIPVLAKAAGVAHTNPQLFYVPRQSALGEYNQTYGDALYMIEERPMDAFAGYESFGRPDEIESTEKLFEELREDEENRLDEGAYLRARLFDMLIGDWDRHTDQWRWAEFKEGKGKIYRPIPRDRDQAFSDFDGALMATARTLMAPARMMQRYGAELNNLEWFNTEPLPMDRVLIRNLTLEDFLKEARYLQANVTDEVISTAFTGLPKELHDHKTTKEIQASLKGRRANLENIAREYYLLLSGVVVLHGTDKDDHILVERLPEKTTRVIIRRIKNGKPADVVAERTYKANETREIWIYALDDKDVFEVKGEAKPGPLLRLVGGQNNDLYNIVNGKKTVLYDYRSKKNTLENSGGAKVKFTDSYSRNHFDFDKNKTAVPSLLPALGYNPDAGFMAGAKYSITNNGFERNPFSSRHQIAALYHFQTQGVAVEYEGEFAGVMDKNNLLVGIAFSTPTFTRNFFGFGSNTENLGEDLGYDYYRVNMSTFRLNTGIVHRSMYGSSWTTTLAYEVFEPEEEADRFLSEATGGIGLFERKDYLTAKTEFLLENYDQKINPAKGMLFRLTTGYQHSLAEADKGRWFIDPEWEMYQPLSTDRRLVLKTRAAAQVNIANDLEFFQAAFLGGNSGLRGFRLNRFTGRNALVFNGDLRYNFKEFKTGFLPLQLGIYGGYDLGTVWHPADTNTQWHNSVGGGLYIAATRLLYLDLRLFRSEEDTRFGFALGVDF